MPKTVKKMPKKAAEKKKRQRRNYSSYSSYIYKVCLGLGYSHIWFSYP